jgi:hypothetical protein
MEVARAAQRTLNDALATAKQLKAKSRDAKRRVKVAKKAAKKASKDARDARKAAAKARRSYKKAVARVAKVRAKAAKGKKDERIVTPKRTSPSRNHPPAARRGDGASARTRRRVWDVAEEAVDNGSESAAAS